MKKILAVLIVIILWFCAQFTGDSMTIASLMGDSFYGSCVSGKVQGSLYLENESFNQLSSEEISKYCMCVSENTPYTTKDMFLFRATHGFYNPFGASDAYNTSQMCQNKIRSN